MNLSHSHQKIQGSRLAVAILLNIFITLFQIIGSIMSGSVALLSDAMHNFSDVLSLVISWWAYKISFKRRTEKRTFGYKRAEILAAFFNASFLIGIGLYLLSESILKLIHKEYVTNSYIIIYMGLLSIILNSVSVLYLKKDSKNNINIKSAYLHLLTDVMTSVAVVINGIVISFFRIFWFDAIVGIAIAFYLIFASFDLAKDAYDILMEFAPPDINTKELHDTIVNFHENIKNIHHLHLWRLTEHDVHLEVHIDFNNNITLKDANKITSNLEKILLYKFNINHCTFQCEYDVNDCKKLIN